VAVSGLGLVFRGSCCVEEVDALFSTLEMVMLRNFFRSSFCHGFNCFMCDSESFQLSQNTV
jgi:hypothetical protein